MDPCIDLIGRPFASGGRGPADFDCYGLVKEVLHRNGVEVPDYPSAADADFNAALVLAAMEAGWEKVDAPEGGVVVLLKIDRATGTHVGVLVNCYQFLHVLKDTRVVIERITSPVWKRRVLGYYRWRGKEAKS